MNKEILKSISILYVEDENDVRTFTARLLENLVKQVFVASNGEEGLEVYNNCSDEIDLILTDINMPKMNGLDMAAKIKEHDKEKPIVLKRKILSLNESFEQKIEKEVSNLKSILDAQSNIVIVTKEKSIVNANKKFLEFFDIESIESYKENNINIFDLFETNFGYIRKNKIAEIDDWYAYINDLPEIDKVVKLKTLTEEERVFALNLNKYDSTNSYFVFSLTDITEIKE